MSRRRVRTEPEREAVERSFLAVRTRQDLALLLGTSFANHLVYYLYRLPPSQRYHSYEIPKRSGGKRLISTPATGLKLVQARLHDVLGCIYTPRANVHGFVAGRGITTNAEAHVRQRHVLNIDLEDFFGTINFGRVRGLFLAKPFSFSKEVATLIAHICCHENKLPQGAPTSPIISNMICARLDSELKRFAQAHRCRYTRYADDITISTPERAFPTEIAYVEQDAEGSRIIQVAPELVSILSANGFKVKTSKTRLLGRDDRQEVTGLTVNRFANVNRRYIRAIRGALHAWRKFDEVGAEAHFNTKYNFSGSNSFRHSIYGRIQYVGAIRGWDDEIYVKLRNEFNDVSDHLKIPTKVLTWEEKAAKAIWVIEDYDDIHQGTAVFVEGYGLVTCAHCVGFKPYIYHPISPSKRYPVVIVGRHNTVDLAILKLATGSNPDYTHLPPQAFQSTLRRGDAIKLFGYPQHAPGKDLSEKEGKIQSFTMKSAIRRFNISAAVVTGNSGGPVINRYRRVAGIAVTGSDDPSGSTPTEEHGVIPIGALQHVIGHLDNPPAPIPINSRKGQRIIRNTFRYISSILRAIGR